MNMNIVIIGRNEAATIKPMADELRKQNLLNSALWVLDRCSDNSEKICKKLMVNYITNNNGEGRMTSFCRNAGYRILSDTMFNEGTLWLDSDRIPVKGDLNSLADSGTDVTLLKNEIDARDTIPVPYSEIYGTVYNQFFSNGIYIKEEACKKIIQFYKEHPEYGKSIIFPENVQEFWGIEDTHLGDICYHLGLTCSLNSDIRLKGQFTKFAVDSIDTIEERFKLRDKLNVKW